MSFPQIWYFRHSSDKSGTLKYGFTNPTHDVAPNRNASPIPISSPRSIFHYVSQQEQVLAEQALIAHTASLSLCPPTVTPAAEHVKSQDVMHADRFFMPPPHAPRRLQYVFQPGCAIHRLFPYFRVHFVSFAAAPQAVSAQKRHRHMDTATTAAYPP